MPRKGKARGGLSYGFPVLPFLAIMLGVMSVMALTTLATSMQRYQEQQPVDVNAVELVGIPADYRPWHLRCEAGRVRWLDADGRWRTADLSALRRIFEEDGAGSAPSRELVELVRFLQERAEENRGLSYRGLQNTLILWVEADAGMTADLLDALIGQLRLPLRTGMLPIDKNDRIQGSHAPTSP